MFTVINKALSSRSRLSHGVKYLLNFYTHVIRLILTVHSSAVLQLWVSTTTLCYVYSVSFLLNMISLYDLQYQSSDIMHVVVFTYLHVIDLFVTIQTNNFILSIHLNRFTLST